jgi:hypothetical protein
MVNPIYSSSSPAWSTPLCFSNSQFVLKKIPKITAFRAPVGQYVSLRGKHCFCLHICDAIIVPKAFTIIPKSSVSQFSDFQLSYICANFFYSYFLKTRTQVKFTHCHVLMHLLSFQGWVAQWLSVGVLILYT